MTHTIEHLYSMVRAETESVVRHSELMDLVIEQVLKSYPGLRRGCNMTLPMHFAAAGVINDSLEQDEALIAATPFEVSFDHHKVELLRRNEDLLYLDPVDPGSKGWFYPYTFGVFHNVETGRTKVILRAGAGKL